MDETIHCCDLYLRRVFRARMNGGDRLSISPDGNALLMDVDCGSEHERKNWDGPQPALKSWT